MFQGYTQGTIDFLWGLKLNNDRSWFAAHKEEFLELVDRPMTASQAAERVCTLYQLFTHKPRRSLRFERNIRFFIEYLVDTGRLAEVCQKGVTYYSRTENS